MTIPELLKRVEELDKAAIPLPSPTIAELQDILDRGGNIEIFPNGKAYKGISWPETKNLLSLLAEIVKVQEEALQYYGWQIVPDSLNSGRTEITTETGRIARRAVARVAELIGGIK